jgi:hypothetical protein
MTAAVDSIAAVFRCAEKQWARRSLEERHTAESHHILPAVAANAL